MPGPAPEPATREESVAFQLGDADIEEVAAPAARGTPGVRPLAQPMAFTAPEVLDDDDFEVPEIPEDEPTKVGTPSPMELERARQEGLAMLEAARARRGARRRRCSATATAATSAATATAGSGAAARRFPRHGARSRLRHAKPWGFAPTRAAGWLDDRAASSRPSDRLDDAEAADIDAAARAGAADGATDRADADPAGARRRDSAHAGGRNRRRLLRLDHRSQHDRALLPNARIRDRRRQSNFGARASEPGRIQALRRKHLARRDRAVGPASGATRRRAHRGVVRARRQRHAGRQRQGRRHRSRNVGAGAFGGLCPMRKRSHAWPRAKLPAGCSAWTCKTSSASSSGTRYSTKRITTSLGPARDCRQRRDP